MVNTLPLPVRAYGKRHGRISALKMNNHQPRNLSNMVANIDSIKISVKGFVGEHYRKSTGTIADYIYAIIIWANSCDI